MIKRRSRFHRTLFMLGSAGPTVLDGALGLWHSDGGRRWLAPLLVFLCATGLLLALAPFIYTIF